MYSTVVSNARKCGAYVRIFTQGQTRLNSHGSLANNYYKTSNEDTDFEEKVMMPYMHIEEIAGKKTRSRLVEAYNHWLQVPLDKVEAVQKICEYMHNYILLMDDLEDNTELRRGIPVPQSIYGVPSSVNTMCYSVFLGIQKCLELHPKAVTILTENMVAIHLVHGMEMYLRDNHKCPTVDEWKDLYIRKLGPIASLPFRLLELFSKNKVEIRNLIDSIIMYSQIKDDYVDLVSADRFEYKLYGDDITEGKFSLPIVHAINQKGGEKILYILRQKTQNLEKKKYCISQMERLGSLEFTLNELKKADNVVRQEVRRLGGNPVFDGLLNEFTYLFEKS